MAESYNNIRFILLHDNYKLSSVGIFMPKYYQTNVFTIDFILAMAIVL